MNVGVLITSGFLAVGVSQLSAATNSVTNTNDSGPGSLRAALSSVADGDTINFSVTGTILLTSGELVVTNSVIILGPGPANLAVDGNAASRVFLISPIESAQAGRTVSISSLTITNGRADDDSVQNGGGIYHENGTLTVSNCTISGNSAPLGGGGIYNGSGTLTVNATIFNSNGGDGSAIYNDYGTLTVSNCTISGDSIYNDGFTGSAAARIIASTFTGGGIHNDGRGFYDPNTAEIFPGNATLMVITSTFSGDSASIYNDGQEFGNATLKVSASTFSGGGLFNNGIAGTAMLEIGNTILEAGTSGGNISNDAGTVASRGYNLSSDNGGGVLTSTGDQINTDPMLGPLQDNGGPTFTHALLPGSPAIDQGKRDAIPALASNADQRGVPRPFDDPAVANAAGGDGSDIGAFEAQPPLAPSKLRATAISASAVVLTWKDNSTIETGFKIRRALSSAGPWSLVANVSKNVTTYTDTSLTAGSTYFYRVRAINPYGRSPWSSICSATPLLSASIPNPASGLTATSVSATQLDLSWTDTAYNESGFKIRRSTDGVTFKIVATTGANLTTYSDTGLTPGTLYYYQIKAYNPTGVAPPSNVSGATTSVGTGE